MCGIFATTDPALLVHQAQVERCLERRGTEKPVWRTTESGSVLAHCLLPVRGEAPILQPVETSQGLLLYSGELWNIDSGHSDTIAFGERIERVGLRRAVARSQGMWALVMVNPHRREIAFCTDVLGEQPLHYAIIGSHVAVASEVKTLVAAGIPLAAISHVRPGMMYEFNGTLKTTPYAAAHSRNRWKTFDVEVLRGRIARAVQSHIQSVDLQEAGVLLSGGIDSTIIAWHASQLGVRKAWTIAVHRQAPDVVAAEQVAAQLGLDWECICCEPNPVEQGVVAAEVVNRSILEESCLHMVLARHLSQRGIRVVLTGSGADELFIGYAHLFRRLPRDRLQQRFLDDYFKLDLRAMNKVYGGSAVEVRNPFLHPAVVRYALQLHASVLIGPKTVLKWPLRSAYADILERQRTEPKKIARETMGAKAWFAARYPDGAKVFHPLWNEILGNQQRLMQILSMIDC
jgi:asparagine synthase (glutamine-hydrolysing)